jgi:hypothetical protein
VTDDELDLLTTEDLWRALCRRNKFVLLAFARGHDGNSDSHGAWWSGSWIGAIGLCEFAKQRVMDAKCDSVKDDDDA